MRQGQSTGPNRAGLCLALMIGAAPALADGQTVVTKTEVISGQLLDAGVECPQFRMDGAAGPGAGEVISLTGAVPADPGAYQLTGRWPRFSYCMQGRSFDVLTFAAAPPAG